MEGPIGMFYYWIGMVSSILVLAIVGEEEDNVITMTAVFWPVGLVWTIYRAIKRRK